MGMNDKVTVRLVVGGLALAFLLCIVGAVLLTLDGDPIPELLVVATSGSLGALAGVLSTTHTVTAPTAPAAPAAPVVDAPLPIVNVFQSPADPAPPAE